MRPHSPVNLDRHFSSVLRLPSPSAVLFMALRKPAPLLRPPLDDTGPSESRWMGMERSRKGS